MTLDELMKQKQLVLLLVNETEQCSFAGLKTSITKDYFDESKGFACVPGPKRTQKEQPKKNHPGFKFGHRLGMRFTDLIDVHNMLTDTLVNCYWYLIWN